MGKIVQMHGASKESVVRGRSSSIKSPGRGKPKLCVYEGGSERDARYKRRAQVLLYQAASLLAEVDGAEQRLAWLLEDCADLLVREEPLGPVA